MKKLFLLAIAATLFVGCGGSDSKTEKKVENPNAIKGLPPSDVYLNMQNQGFDYKKTENEEGIMWENHLVVGNFDYRVQTFSRTDDAVESVRVIITTTPPDKAYEAESFIGMIATLPYPTNDFDKTNKWLAKNISKDKATTVIGDARWTIYAPTKWARTIYVETAQTGNTK